MIPSKLGRRLSAFLCAVALMVALVGFPLRARAAAAVFPTIGYAVTISAFLAACGIYPFQNENGQSFGEWGARQLTDLWNIYVTEVYPQSEGAQLISDVKSFYANGGYMVMAADTWARLREFAGWIVDEFSVTDNQIDVRAGKVDNGLMAVPSVSGEPSNAQIRAYGLKVFIDSSGGTCVATVDGVYCYAQVATNVHGLREYGLYYVSKEAFGLYFERSPYIPSQSSSDSGHQYSLDGRIFTLYSYPYSSTLGYGDGTRAKLSPNLPIFDYDLMQSQGVSLRDDILRRVYELSDDLPLEGIMADTSVVQLLDELPEGAQMGGLAVAGAGATPETLQDVIESGVMERQQPIVRSVTVEIGEGMEVDAGTGAVAQAQSDTLVITPELAETLPVASDFAAPQALVDSLVSALRTKFPFCLPFDALRIASAFLKEPSAPVISMTFHDPFSDSDYTVSVDLSPWDDVAAVVRQLQSLLLLVGFMLNAPRVLLFKEMLS